MSKTIINQRQLYEERNTSDVLPRLIIMGLLRILNKKLVYQQVWDDSENGVQDVTVPFFFDFSASNNSEKFIQDNYMHWTDEECTSIGLKKIDGDFKSVPYGVLSLESTSIDSGSITNRFVMGKYDKKVGGLLRSFVSYLYSIPLTMQFSVNVVCDSVNSMWKIEQAYREYFYKNKTFHVNYRGTVVPCRVGFPESLSSAKTNTYTIGQNTEDHIKLSFSLSCETYQPVFDPYNERPAENTIKNISAGILLKKNTGEELSPEQIGKLKAVTDLSGVSITTGEDVLLEWDFSYDRADLLAVDILFQEEGESDYSLIDTVENHNCYHLEIQDDFVEDPVLVDVVIPHNDGAVIVTNPQFKFIADPDSSIVSSRDVRILDKGFIVTSNERIMSVLSYESSDGHFIEQPMAINIKDNMVDPENPVEFDDFIYLKPFKCKKIKLFVRDRYNPEIIVPFQRDGEWVTVF